MAAEMQGNERSQGTRGSPRGGQFLDDRESLVALVDMMPRVEKDVYNSYGALTLEASFPNRKMVVYTLRGGRPENVEILNFGDLGMDRFGGPYAFVGDSQGDFSIGMVPTRYRDREVFLHIPQNFVFKWKGKQKPSDKVEFVPHYAVLVKTRSKEIHQVEGHTYCVTFNKFQERFPDVRLRY
jgi:hypothetical protein